METPAELRARAERTLRQRSLDKLSASVADPSLRTMAREFASGDLNGVNVETRNENATVGAALKASFYDGHLFGTGIPRTGR